MAEKRSLLFLNRFYWPDVAATGQMLTDLAEDLAAQGWEVTVVTSGSAYGGSSQARPREETRAGVRIVRVRTARAGRHSLAGRLSEYGSYVLGAARELVRLPRPRIAVAMSDPPFMLALVLLAGWLRGFRTVYWVQDLYPQLLGSLGVMRRSGVAYRLLERAARSLHARCDAVIALGPRMAERLVEAGARPDRTSFVHNWADEEKLRPVPAERNPFLGEHGLEGRFVVLYSGNAGRAHVFDTVVEAARRLREDPRVVFLFIGGGQRLAAIRAAVARDALPNVRFLDYLPRDQIHLSLSAASVSLVTEEPSVAGLLVPSKTYGILASGRPLFFVGSEESDVAAVVREAGCGVVIAPDDAQALVRAVKTLRDDPEAAARMGARARRAAEEVYARRAATRRWIREVESLLTPAAERNSARRGDARLMPHERLS